MKKIFVAIVAVIVLASCAGIGNKSRVCIEEAVDHNQEKSEKFDRMHSEPRVTDSCEKVSQDGNFALFHCDVADAIDDEDYAHLLDMQMRSLRMRIESCLNR